MMDKTIGYMLIMILVWPIAVQANTIKENTSNLEQQLIAPCCWRAPLEDHYSGVAESMKEEIRVMLADGKTQEEILAHFTDIHGDRILSKPPNEGFNRMAYVFPGFMMFTGIGLIFFTLRRWRRKEEEQVTQTEDCALETVVSDKMLQTYKARIKDDLQRLD